MSVRLKLIAIAFFLAVILLNSPVSTAQHKEGDGLFLGRGGEPFAVMRIEENDHSRLEKFRNNGSFADNNLLPVPKIHPLPISLAQWSDKNNQEDYFKQIKPTPLGYLIWSQFPIKIYLEGATKSNDNSASSIRQQQWLEAVRLALAEWNIYISLQEINNRELADIIVVGSTPEREVKINPETGLYDIPRAITAQTNYQFYWQENKILSHRMNIQVSPNLSQQAILAATRHEFGHALGIWGHSPHQNDALYFSQVRDFPPISTRDINTLKKIYQQPTRLGWLIKE